MKVARKIFENIAEAGRYVHCLEAFKDCSGGLKKENSPPQPFYNFSFQNMLFKQKLGTSSGVTYPYLGKLPLLVNKPTQRSYLKEGIFLP